MRKNFCLKFQYANIRKKNLFKHKKCESLHVLTENASLTRDDVAYMSLNQDE